MYKRQQGDRQILAKQLGISPHQLSYVTHTNSGEGPVSYTHLIQTVDQAAAVKSIKAKVSDIDKMKVEEQKKAARSGYDLSLIHISPIVRLIFGYALNGHGPNYIRRRLEEEKIPCPTWWNRERGLRNTRTKWEKKDPENGRYMWDFSVIKDLLMNPVYTGAIASQKKDYRFKIGTIGEKKPEDWIVVEGQHEPLIDRMSFDIVQNKLKSRQRPGQTDEISLFAGLLKCGECGKSLTVRYTNAKHPQRIYSCKTYNAFGKNHCTQHRIDYDTLYSHVLRKIRECARAALMDGEAVADRLTNTCEAEQREQREAMERSLTCLLYTSTYTSNLLANGAAPKDVQELLGHSDVSTTMNVDVYKRQFMMFTIGNLKLGIL